MKNKAAYAPITFNEIEKTLVTWGKRNGEYNVAYIGRMRHHRKKNI